MSRISLNALLLPLLLCASQAMAGAPTVGDMAPDFLGKPLKGETLKLADFKGKVVVITFWATWCSYCIKEIPVLENLQQAAKDRLQVIAINTEERDVFRATMRALPSLTMKMTHDSGGYGHAAYAVKGIPHLVIIGRDGKILAVHKGYSESTLSYILETINDAIGAPVETSGAQ